MSLPAISADHSAQKPPPGGCCGGADSGKGARPRIADGSTVKEAPPSTEAMRAAPSPTSRPLRDRISGARETGRGVERHHGMGFVERPANPACRLRAPPRPRREPASASPGNP